MREVRSLWRGTFPESNPFRAERIIRQVAEEFGLTVDELKSPERTRRVAYPRFKAMYRLKTETELSLPAIGRRLGGRDHTTVLHGVRKWAAMSEAAE